MILLHHKISKDAENGVRRTTYHSEPSGGTRLGMSAASVRRAEPRDRAAQGRGAAAGRAQVFRAGAEVGQAEDMEDLKEF